MSSAAKKGKRSLKESRETDAKPVAAATAAASASSSSSSKQAKKKPKTSGFVWYRYTDPFAPTAKAEAGEFDYLQLPKRIEHSVLFEYIRRQVSEVTRKKVEESIRKQNGRTSAAAASSTSSSTSSSAPAAAAAAAASSSSTMDEQKEEATAEETDDDDDEDEDLTPARRAAKKKELKELQVELTKRSKALDAKFPGYMRVVLLRWRGSKTPTIDDLMQLPRIYIHDDSEGEFSEAFSKCVIKAGDPTFDDKSNFYSYTTYSSYCMMNFAEDALAEFVRKPLAQKKFELAFVHLLGITLAMLKEEHWMRDNEGGCEELMASFNRVWKRMLEHTDQELGLAGENPRGAIEQFLSAFAEQLLSVGEEIGAEYKFTWSWKNGKQVVPKARKPASAATSTSSKKKPASTKKKSTKKKKPARRWMRVEI